MVAGFGVHLGNSSICVAQSKEGKTDVIANDLGDRVTPAVLSHNGQEYEMCNSAKIGCRSKTFIMNNKAFIEADLSDEQIELLNARSEWQLTKANGSLMYQLKVKNKTISITPYEIASKFYKEMYIIAANALPKSELKAVFAVPQDFTEESRKKLAEAAESAGFTVLQIINEPVAAVLAYDNWSYTESHSILIYRLGGMSCDVSIVSVTGGLYTVEKHTSEIGIGGIYITRLLSDFIAKEFYQRWKLDPNENRRAMDKLFHYANTCKHVLSTLSSAHVFIESLYEGVDWSQNVTRARFENLLLPNRDEYTAPVRRILKGNNFKKKIDSIIFCGGSMKIPKLQSIVSSLFPKAHVMNGHSPDEVIAEGCAKQAALILEFDDTDIYGQTEEFDCISKPIYAKYMNTRIDVFGRGTPNYAEVYIPFKRVGKSSKIHLELFEEDSDTPLCSGTFTSKSNSLKLHVLMKQFKLTINVS